MGEIWKFPLVLCDQPSVLMPTGAKVLSAGCQGEDLFVWAWVPDTAAPKETRNFFVFGTGNPIDFDLRESTFIGTVQAPVFVWHVYDQRSQAWE